MACSKKCATQKCHFLTTSLILPPFPIVHFVIFPQNPLAPVLLTKMKKI